MSWVSDRQKKKAEKYGLSRRKPAYFIMEGCKTAGPQAITLSLVISEEAAPHMVMVDFSSPVILST